MSLKNFSEFLSKVKEFITKSGFTKLFYLLIFVWSFLYGHKLLAGASIGIFLYINYNILRKLIFGSKE